MGKRWNSSKVSIHAPVPGATDKSVRFAVGVVFQFTPLCQGLLERIGEPILNELFQFTPLCQGLRMPLVIPKGDIEFQFTPLCQGLLEKAIDILEYYGFNSRPCARGYKTDMKDVPLRYVSIHAPVPGATLE